MNGDITLFLDGLVNAWFNNIENIIVGVISSLVATILWLAIDSIRKSISSKKKISILLDLLYDSADSFDSAMVSENEEIAEEFLKYRIHEALHAVASDQKTVSFLLEHFGQYVYPAVFPKLIEYSRKNNFTESQIAFMEFCNKNSVNTDNIGNLSL